MKKLNQILASTSSSIFTGTICACLAIAFLPATANAEYFGLIAGREATPAKTSELSVELGIATGEIDDQDYQNVAARVNYRLSPELVFMGTVGIGELGLTDGIPLGVGVLYHLPNQRISDSVEIAGKASYHFGDYSYRDLDGDVSSLALEVVVSGREPFLANGTTWYSNFGYSRTTVDFGQKDSSSDPIIGIGAVMPTGLGDAYLGFEYIDELTFGLGFRYYVP